jgi:hypothetical protein
LLFLEHTWKDNKGKYILRKLFTNKTKDIIFDKELFYEYNSKIVKKQEPGTGKNRKNKK